MLISFGFFAELLSVPEGVYARKSWVKMDKAYNEIYSVSVLAVRVDSKTL